MEGLVTDSVTGEGLPYAALQIKGTTLGTATDADGHFSFSVPKGKKILVVSYLGYDSREMILIPEKKSHLEISLPPSGIHLGEVVIKTTKEKYRKKDNPAVRLVREIIERKKLNTPYAHDYFSYERYEKVLFAMNEYTPKPPKKGKKGKFRFVEEFVDLLFVGFFFFFVLFFVLFVDSFFFYVSVSMWCSFKNTSRMPLW